MMIEPPLGKLLEKVDSRYSLVIATAKRARQIAENDPSMLKYGSSKPVTIALNEINDGTVTVSEGAPEATAAPEQTDE